MDATAFTSTCTWGSQETQVQVVPGRDRRTFSPCSCLCIPEALSWPLCPPTPLPRLPVSYWAHRSPTCCWPSLRFGSEHLHSHTHSLGRIQTFAPGNQLDRCTHKPHFKQDWPLLQPALSTSLLCSSPTSLPAHPPCMCTVNLPTSWTLGFTPPMAAKSQFACGFSAAHQCEK